jgi:hypothetical protein
MKLWQRIRGEDFSSYEVALSLEQFSQDLFQSIKYPSIGFKGDEDKLVFPTLRGNSIVEVTYEFIPSGLLVRKERGLKDLLEDNEEYYIERGILEAEDVKFTYFYFDEFKGEYEWIDSWEKEGEIPKGVDINIKSRYGEFEKKVFLPVAY